MSDRSVPTTKGVPFLKGKNAHLYLNLNTKRTKVQQLNKMMQLLLWNGVSMR